MLIDSMVSTAPHSGSVLEIFTSGGIALFVIGASTLLSRPLRWVLLPLSAIGAMPLTAYTLHALVILALTGPAGYLTSNPACLLLILSLAIACPHGPRSSAAAHSSASQPEPPAGSHPNPPHTTQQKQPPQPPQPPTLTDRPDTQRRGTRGITKHVPNWAPSRTVTSRFFTAPNRGQECIFATHLSHWVYPNATSPTER